MTRYATGVAKERKAKAEMEKEGFTVIRASGSHGFADLVGINAKTREVKFVQVKVTGSPHLFRRELDELADLCPKGKYDVTSYLYVWPKGGRDWARKELAT